MIKKIVYFLLIATIGYGLYYLFSMFPLESTIGCGIIAILIIIKWITDIEQT